MTLSGSTLGLKFMQRAAAKKAETAPAEAEHHEQNNRIRQEVKVEQQQASTAHPIASSSKLPAPAKSYALETPVEQDGLTFLQLDYNGVFVSRISYTFFRIWSLRTGRDILS